MLAVPGEIEDIALSLAGQPTSASDQAPKTPGARRKCHDLGPLLDKKPYFFLQPYFKVDSVMCPKL